MRRGGHGRDLESVDYDLRSLDAVPREPLQIRGGFHNRIDSILDPVHCSRFAGIV